MSAASTHTEVNKRPLAAFAVRPAALRHNARSGRRVGARPDCLHFVFHLFVNANPLLSLAAFLYRISFNLLAVGFARFTLLINIRHRSLLFWWLQFRAITKLPRSAHAR